MKKLYVADLFCGAGGTSTGAIQAAQSMGRKVELVAVNHWDVAVETHAANHPWANHLCQTLDNVDPRRAVPGGKLDLLVASPECTHHSIARGGKPCSDQSRSSAWCVLRWIDALRPKAVILENVREFQDWGPLNEKGRPMKSEKGRTFRAFLQSIRSMGYRVDFSVLNCANYGDPTTRQRLFILAVKGRKKPTWPAWTHMEKDLALFPENLPKWRPARDIIDWSIPGKSIFNRKKPLADKTMARIQYGLEKFGGKNAEPFLVLMKGQSMARDISYPTPTITTNPHLYLCEPFTIPIDHASLKEKGALSVSRPLGTITTKQRHALVEPFLISYHGGGPEKSPEKRVHTPDDPIPTLDCSNRFGLINPYIIKYYGTGKAQGLNGPLDTVTTKDRFGLIQGAQLDITLRMLEPHELAAAMSFPAGYEFAGNKGEKVKQIGNAVPVRTARELCKAALLMAA